MLITPTGSVLEEMRPADLVIVDLATGIATGGKPSSESDAHRAIYRRRPDVAAIVHAHPPICVGFALARMDMGKPCNLEIYATIGRPARVKFAAPGESGSRLEPVLDDSDCFLLDNHGVITLGQTPTQARHRLEALEAFAKSLLVARLLGGEKPFNASEIAAIRRYCERAGLVLR